MTPEILGPEAEAVSGEADTTQDPDKRQAWERPVLRRLSADMAELGMGVRAEAGVHIRS
jgi:hypothetical protein